MPGPRKMALGKPKNTKRVVARILSYLRPYTLRLVLVAVCICISAGAGADADAHGDKHKPQRVRPQVREDARDNPLCILGFSKRHFAWAGHQATAPFI